MVKLLYCVDVKLLLSKLVKGFFRGVEVRGEVIRGSRTHTVTDKSFAEPINEKRVSFNFKYELDYRYLVKNITNNLYLVQIVEVNKKIYTD